MILRLSLSCSWLGHGCLFFFIPIYLLQCHLALHLQSVGNITQHLIKRWQVRFKKRPNVRVIFVELVNHLLRIIFGHVSQHTNPICQRKPEWARFVHILVVELRCLYDLVELRKQAFSPHHIMVLVFKIKRLASAFLDCEGSARTFNKLVFAPSFQYTLHIECNLLLRLIILLLSFLLGAWFRSLRNLRSLRRARQQCIRLCKICFQFLCALWAFGIYSRLNFSNCGMYRITFALRHFDFLKIL